MDMSYCDSPKLPPSEFSCEGFEFWVTSFWLLTPDSSPCHPFLRNASRISLLLHLYSLPHPFSWEMPRWGRQACNRGYGILSLLRGKIYDLARETLWAGV